MRQWLQQHANLEINPTNEKLVLKRLFVLKHCATVIDLFAAGLSASSEAQVLALECVLHIVEIIESANEASEQLTDSISTIIQRGSLDAAELLRCLCAAHSCLEQDLVTSLVQPFTGSPLAAKAAAWLSKSPVFYRATLSEVLSDTVLSACYFLFLSDAKR
jgi:hypothetical protein